MPPSSSSPSLLEPLKKSSKTAEKWMLCLHIFNVVVSLYHLINIILHPDNMLDKPPLAVEFPSPSPAPSPYMVVSEPPFLPLPEAHSLIKEDCTPCLHKNPSCVETLASIPSIKYARSTADVMTIAVANLYNMTIDARSELFDMLERVRKNTQDYSKHQQKLVQMCAEESERILDYRFVVNDAFWHQAETLGGFIDSALFRENDCAGELAREPDWFEDGGSYKPLAQDATSIWDRIDRLGEICSCIVDHKQIANLKLQELNPQPLMLLTGDGYGEHESPAPARRPPPPPSQEEVLGFLRWSVRRVLSAVLAD